MEIAITVNKLQRNFGKLAAVDDVSLQLESGDIFGLVGPNGSGKSTLIKMLATIIKPTSGTAYILGYDIIHKSQKVRGFIGYLPNPYSAYYDLKVYEYMDFFAGAYRINKSERKNIVNDVLELVNLASCRDCYIRELSNGMMQKLGIARILIHDPAVLLLDEPLFSLDPKSRIEVMEIFKELGNMGKTLLISTGIISDVMSICNKIGVMVGGKIIVSDNVENINISDYF